MQSLDRKMIFAAITSAIAASGCKDPGPAKQRPPAEEERLFEEGLSDRACDLLPRDAVAEVAGVEVSEVSLSDINAEHHVVDECLYFWRPESIRRSARLFDIRIAGSVEQARERFEAAAAEEHPKRDLRPLSDLGDAAYWNAARWRRHTKSPTGERSADANEVWVRVANLQVRVQFLGGRLDRAYKDENLALARAVVKRLSSVLEK